MRRLILVLVAVASMSIMTSLATVALAPMAGAASGTTCAKVKGNATGNITISKCTFVSGKDKTNKSLSGATTSLAAGGTLTWSPSGQTTTIGPPSFTAVGQGGCKANNTEYDASGTVIGGSSTHTQNGDTFSARVCVNNKNNKISLVKGTVVDL